MIVTTKDTNNTYSITLRPWDGCQWLPDIADELFAVDFGWLIHNCNCQCVFLDIKEVQA